MTRAWDSHYTDLIEPEPYGDLRSYELAAEWVKGCATVEDRGCGKGWLRQFIDPNAYIGIDGSNSPFADGMADLTEYVSECEGIVLRHVLEHSYEWTKILDCAVASFTRRLIVILFTPLVDVTQVLMTEPDYDDVPVIAFEPHDLTDRIPLDCETTVETIEAPGSAYGVETLIRVAR